MGKPERAIGGETSGAVSIGRARNIRDRDYLGAGRRATDQAGEDEAGGPHDWSGVASGRQQVEDEGNKLWGVGRRRRGDLHLPVGLTCIESGRVHTYIDQRHGERSGVGGPGCGSDGQPTWSAGERGGARRPTHDVLTDVEDTHCLRWNSAATRNRDEAEAAL